MSKSETLIRSEELEKNIYRGMKKTIKGSVVLTLLMGFMLIFMTLYEWIKQLIFPDISIWGSHIITICFSSLVATMAAYVVVKRYQALLHQSFLLKMQIETRNAELTVLNRELHLEIAERKTAEEAYRTLVEQSLQGIMVLQDYRIVFTNQSAADIFGYTMEELLAMLAEEVQALTHPDDRTRIVSRLAGKPASLRYELRIFRKDGTVRWLEAAASRITYQGKSVAQIFYIDITKRKQKEEQIKNQNLLLEKAVQQKQQEMEALFERLLRQEKLATIGQMAGSIAHELRNPLGAIKQSIFFLNRLYHKEQLGTSNPKVKKHLDLIGAELDISERVISDLLQMTRMKPPQREQIALRPIIEDAVNRCHLPEQIHLTIELPPEPLLILADSMQLRQVLINLITNAAQAIDREGSISIKTKILAEDELLVIELEDTGNGIEPAALDKVFEPLYTTKTTGTGLGLSICKQIIENHQGQINVQSSVGNGTTVTMILPA